MSLPEDYTTVEAPSERPVRSRRRRGMSIRLSCTGMLLIVLADLLVLGAIAWPLLRVRYPFSLLFPLPSGLPATLTLTPHFASVTPSGTASPSSTPQPSLPHTASPIPPAVTLATLDLKNELVVLSLREGNDTHLFAYQPRTLPLTRLTEGAWDDITPAISPDGDWVAFASNRNGYWDLYLLELASGEVFPLTDTREYDAAPSWSPDSRWLTYESYQENNLEIMILPVDGSQPPLRLTANAAADFSPVWSPQGRQIAYISTRGGEQDVWLFDLDAPADETNLSQTASVRESHPAWSPDGSRLAWASFHTEDGYHGITILDTATSQTTQIGSGDWPAFDADGEQILSLLRSPVHTYLTAYDLKNPGLALPPLEMPNAVEGFSWADVAFPWPLPSSYRQAVMLTPTPLWEAAVTPVEGAPGGRSQVVALPKEVEAPYPLLLDGVDESFRALRARLGTEIGWDFLASLENAYVPLTTSLDPGDHDSWLYTGRGMAVNPLPINAGWMAVMREDFGAETRWRIFLRARFQDGSAGMPLHDFPWDFNARFTGDTSAYEAGGALSQSIPAGYWVDFTAMAAAHGWERLPALSRWQSALKMARFNQFVLTEGLDWRTAMLALYPPEVLVTPTAIVPPTRTPSPTPRWYQTATPTTTDTPRPTYTPLPTITLTPTITATPTVTPKPSPTKRPSIKSPTPLDGP